MEWMSDSKEHAVFKCLASERWCKTSPPFTSMDGLGSTSKTDSHWSRPPIRISSNATHSLGATEVGIGDLPSSPPVWACISEAAWSVRSGQLIKSPHPPLNHLIHRLWPHWSWRRWGVQGPSHPLPCVATASDPIRRWCGRVWRDQLLFRWVADATISASSNSNRIRSRGEYGGGCGWSSLFLPSPSWQNDLELTGPDHSAKTTGPSLRSGPSTPMCSDPMLGSGPWGLVPFPNISHTYASAEK